MQEKSHPGYRHLREENNIIKNSYIHPSYESGIHTCVESWDCSIAADTRDGKKSITIKDYSLNKVNIKFRSAQDIGFFKECLDILLESMDKKISIKGKELLVKKDSDNMEVFTIDVLFYTFATEKMSISIGNSGKRITVDLNSMAEFYSIIMKIYQETENPQFNIFGVPHDHKGEFLEFITVLDMPIYTWTTTNGEQFIKKQ